MPFMAYLIINIYKIFQIFVRLKLTPSEGLTPILKTYIPHTMMSLPANDRRSCQMRSSQVFSPERSKMMR